MKDHILKMVILGVTAIAGYAGSEHLLDPAVLGVISALCGALPGLFHSKPGAAAPKQ